MISTTHTPKGSMCMTCIYKTRKCNHLEFDKMKVIQDVKHSNLKVVKCADFTKSNSK